MNSIIQASLSIIKWSIYHSYLATKYSTKVETLSIMIPIDSKKEYLVANMKEKKSAVFYYALSTYIRYSMVGLFFYTHSLGV